MEEADTLCQRIAILDHGKMLALGSPSELEVLHGADSVISITVEGDAGVLRNEAERLDAVRRIEVLDGTIRVFANPPLGVLARLVELAADAGLPVRDASSHAAEPRDGVPQPHRPGVPRMSRQLGTFGAMLARDLRVVRRQFGQFLLRTIMQPLLFVFVFAYVFPKIGQGFSSHGSGVGSFTTVLVPGLIAVAINFQGIQSVAIPLVQEFSVSKEIEDRVLAPMPVWGSRSRRSWRARSSRWSRR